MMSESSRDVYFPHLDGLRAMAILGVLLFHFDVPLFRGGFIGVDIFFTLSGFLITHTLLTRASQRPSIMTFYRKRFFRLYPASLVVVSLTLLSSHLFIRPAYHQVVCQSAVASLAFVSNFFFHGNGEYFTTTFDMRPLLHFWSLSVEEQFYFIWPAVIILCRHNTRVLFVALSLIFLSSLVLSAALFTRHATFVFYQLPTRAFQFAAGALLYVVLYRRGVINQWSYRHSSIPSSSTKNEEKAISDTDDITSVIMAAVILLSFSFLPTRPHPLLTVPVTAATCVLIAMPSAVVCDVVFTTPPLVWIGKHSYAIYLVHWPLAIIGAYVLSGTSVPIPSQPLFLFLSFYLGSKLNKYIEAPFRCRSGKSPNLTRRVTLFSLLALTMIYAGIGSRYDGYKSRFPQDGKTGWPVGIKPVLFWNTCTDVSSQFEPVNDNIVVCRLGAVTNGSRGNVYFFGDSFAGHLRVGLHVLGLKRNEYYDVRFINYCGFRTMWHYKTLSKSPNGFPCSDGVGSMWEHMKYIPNGSTVAVANWWGEPYILKTTIRELRDEVNKRGKNLAVIAEPPGMNEEKYRGYYACADTSVLALGRLWQWIRYGQSEALLGGKRCVERDLESGVEPKPAFLQMQKTYHDIFGAKRYNDEGVTLVNVFEHMCVNETNHWRCRVPLSIPSRAENGSVRGTVVHDIGYEPDLTHLTSVGSYHISPWLESDLIHLLDGHPQNKSQT